ncbi:hypothetical protein [Segniliparus rugosus]|uniref:Uncharacterized protein n=1 Tax=Segniliparus rugosus (strain ATCC BAA-974 / DSM 45345 / CCUG 50838 / CIP 108380 / JCM 13579 / CDC 945) TaxID=679197 RepID=E5XMS2_SEGRC|nr:hypothetical protein [Segniliparus rugosus]EFV14342.1 hypothetical protein HMPREF9336_00792 [Segniliparus rugosus ATCC BAA-974]
MVISLLVVCFAVIGLLVSGYTVLLDAGVIPADYLVYKMLAERIEEITGQTPEQQFKGLRNRFRNTRIEILSSFSQESRIPWTVRRFFKKRFLKKDEPPTGREIISFLRTVRASNERFYNPDSAPNLCNLLPFCAESSASTLATDAERLGRLAIRRGQLISRSTTRQIADAQTLDDLYKAHRHYTFWKTRIIFEAMFGLRRIQRGKGPRQVVYWKRLLTYSGKGGGVGAIVSNAFYSAPITKTLPFPVIGGTIALFAFTVKALTFFYATPGRGDLDTRFARLARKRPLLAASLFALAMALLAAGFQWWEFAQHHIPWIAKWVKAHH